MKIFFALSGANESNYGGCLEPAQVPNILGSYFYFRGIKHDRLIKWLKIMRQHTECLFLDSGAHTFLAAYDMKVGNPGIKGMLKDPGDTIKYYEEYREWLKIYGKYFDIIAELDIGQLPQVGYALVQKWRDELNLLGFHDKLAVVSHYIHFINEFGDWKPEWQNLLNEYPYVAIGDEPDGSVLHNHFALWKQTGNYNRVHGFAETKNDKIKNYPYYSVDSTSWVMGGRWGAIMYFDKSTMSLKMVRLGLNKHNMQQKFAKIFKQLHSSSRQINAQTFWHKANKIGGYPRNIQSLFAYMEMEIAMTELWKKRGVDFDKNLPLVLKGGSQTIADPLLITP